MYYYYLQYLQSPLLVAIGGNNTNVAMLLISEKANIYGEDMVSYCLIVIIIYIILLAWAITCFNGYCFEEYSSGQVFNV